MNKNKSDNNIKINRDIDDSKKIGLNMSTNKLNNNIKDNNTKIKEHIQQEINNIFNQKDNEKHNTIKINRENIDNFEKIGILIDENVYKNEKLKLYEIKFDFEKFKKLKEILTTPQRIIPDINGAKCLIHINNQEIDYNKIKKLQKLGFNLSTVYDIEILYNLEIDFDKLEKFKKIGIIIDKRNIDDWNKLEISDDEILLCKKYGITEYYDILFLSSIFKNTKRGKIREFIDRKNEYLKNNQTISKEKFEELFGGSGKFGKTEINQTGIALCFAYIRFELLKKTNGFNELIQTNLKENEKGWEVRFPFCDSNGIWYKVNKEEIDKEFTVPKKNGKKRTFSINSESKYLGFKILEIAFIKRRVIDEIRGGERFYDNLEKISEILDEFFKTGDITITGELIEKIERGYVNDMNNLLPRNYLISKFGNKTLSDKMKDLAFEHFPKGLYKIPMTIDLENNNHVGITTKETKEFGTTVIVNDVRIINQGGIKNETDDIITNEEGKDSVMFIQRHAYLIERCYIDKETGEKRVWVINPQHTGIKFDISLEECKKIFDWEIIGINIDKMFR